MPFVISTQSDLPLNIDFNGKLTEMFFVGPLTLAIRNFEFLRSQLFLDASILAAMAVNIDIRLLFQAGQLFGQAETPYHVYKRHFCLCKRILIV